MQGLHHLLKGPKARGSAYEDTESQGLDTQEGGRPDPSREALEGSELHPRRACCRGLGLLRSLR